MKLMIFILSRTEVLAQFLEGLSTAGIKGATIIESDGLAATVARLDSNFFGASLRALFNTAEGNKTILSLIADDQIEIVRKVCYATVGNLSDPNTGILFTVPVDFAEGIVKNDKKPV